MNTLQHFQYEMITQNNFFIITNYYEINNSRNSSHKFYNGVKLCVSINFKTKK